MHPKNETVSNFQQWFTEWENQETFNIAGPCSAESYEQLQQCVQVMQHVADWHVLRLGIWKPRSRPGGFEGNKEALVWLRELQSQYSFKSATEIANAEHVEAALSANINILWIGARTVGLPFLVEEIACALQDQDIPILVKNPLSPDVNLWRGAVERLLNRGIKKIALVHRGFSLPYANDLRNWPLWSAVAQMKLFFPDISVLCDPSHIAGDVAKVPMIAEQAMQFGCNGLMVECHPQPSLALTDAAQQIPLAQMENFLAHLHHPKELKDHSSLHYQRLHIDEIDQQILHLLKKRDEVIEKIAATKKDQNLQVVDYHRYQQMLTLRKEWFNAQYSESDGHYVDQLFHLIHERSIQRQLKILSQSDSQ